MTTRQPAAHYHRSQQQELAPALVLVGGDGQDARAIHRRWYILQHSCRMVQGSSSWPRWVDATDLCCLRDLMMMMVVMVLEHYYTHWYYILATRCSEAGRSLVVVCDAYM